MGKTAFVLGMLVLMTMTISVGLATEYQVKQDGTGDFTTIQAAIDATVSAEPWCYPTDEVLVHPGTYRENICFNGKNIAVKAVVELMAIIDGGGNGPVVQFVGTESSNCKLWGFIVTNGYSPTGGGIRGADNQHGFNGDKQYTQAEIHDCYIIANTATIGGGGVSEFAGSFTSCAIIGNTCDDGFGGGFAACDASLNSCQVQYNRGRYGGGFSYVSVLLYGGNQLSDNVANYGGVFYGSLIRSSYLCLDSNGRNQADEGGFAYGCTFEYR